MQPRNNEDPPASKTQDRIDNIFSTMVHGARAVANSQLWSHHRRQWATATVPDPMA